jgi:hypothetical protein
MGLGWKRAASRTLTSALWVEGFVIQSAERHASVVSSLLRRREFTRCQQSDEQY